MVIDSMRLKSLRTSSIDELNRRTGTFVAACGYEHRSGAISTLIHQPATKVALCFREWSDALARRDNEKYFSGQGFDLRTIGGNEAGEVQTVKTERLPVL